MAIPPILIQPGTTNLLSNPRAAIDTSSSVALGGSTVTRDATANPVAATAFSVATPGSGASEGLYLFTPSALGVTGEARTYRGSGWIGGAGSITVQLRAFYTDATSTIGSTATVTAGDAFPVGISSLTLDPAKTLNLLRVYIRTSGTQATTFKAIAQVEHGNATAYTDGTRPDHRAPGYLPLGAARIGPLRAGKD